MSKVVLPYLKPERPQGQAGPTYWYVRHPVVGRIRINDGLMVPVDAGPDDAQFIARYRSAVDRIDLGKKEGVRPTVVPRSLQHLIDVYRASPEFSQLAETTRTDYKKALRLLEKEFGTLPVVGLRPHFLTRIRDRFAYVETRTPHGNGDALPPNRRLAPRRANKILTVLSILMSYAVSMGWRTDNPCMQQGRSLRLRVGEWKAWPDDALTQFWHSASRELMVASAVAVFTGLRGQDQIQLC